MKSQITNPIAKTCPTKNRRQNQGANVAPAKIAIPTKIGAKNAAIPIRGFGNPNSAACSLSITDLQLISGEMSHDVDSSGFSATRSLSSVKPKLAIQPMTPMEINAIGNSMLQLSHFGNNSCHTLTQMQTHLHRRFIRRAMCPEDEN